MGSTVGDVLLAAGLPSGGTATVAVPSWVRLVGGELVGGLVGGQRRTVGGARAQGLGGQRRRGRIGKERKKKGEF